MGLLTLKETCVICQGIADWSRSNTPIGPVCKDCMDKLLEQKIYIWALKKYQLSELQDKCRIAKEKEAYENSARGQLKKKIIVVPNIVLNNGEICYYRNSASAVHYKNVVVGTKSNAAGMSFRIAKGVSVRTGSSTSTAIRKNVDESYEGTLYITNQRIILLAPKYGFDVPFGEITSLLRVQDGFQIYVGTKCYTAHTKDIENIIKTFGLLDAANSENDEKELLLEEKKKQDALFQIRKNGTRQQKSKWKWIISILLFLSAVAYFPSFSSFLFVLPGILLLPVDTIQNKVMLYMNKTVRIILIIICVVVALVLAPADKNAEETLVESNLFSEQINDVVESTSEVEKEESDIDVIYHSNDEINDLIARYNKLAMYTITPEMVSEGAYDYKARVLCNNVVIDIYATSENGLFVDYEHEAIDDQSIEALFKDFCRAIVVDVTDEELEIAWKELQTEEYDDPYNNNLNVKGIDCTYWSVELNNGTRRFFVKTNYLSDMK